MVSSLLLFSELFIDMMILLVMRKRVSKSFHRWMLNARGARMRDELQFQTQNLVASSSLSSQRENELKLKLLEEQQKLGNLQAQYTILSRELKATQDRLQAVSISQNIRGRQEQELNAELKMEKERAVIMTAKYNALVQQSERDKADLMAQLAKVQRNADTRRTSTL